jgi:hypothetical protein
VIRIDWTSRKSTLKGSRNLESHCGRGGGGGGGGLLQSKALNEVVAGREPASHLSCASAHRPRITNRTSIFRSYRPSVTCWLSINFSLSISLSHTHTHVPFPPRRTGRYRKGMISARPSYQGVRRSVWNLETFARAGGTSHAEARLEGAAR